MNILRNSFRLIFFFFVSEISFGQELPRELITREINRQLFDTDGQLPGFYTLTNKYHEVNYGLIKSETIVSSSLNERVIREFNRQGSMIQYQVCLHDKLRSDFTYDYNTDGFSLLRERGTYDLDYFQIDSFTNYGIPVGEGKGFNFGLDTLFLKETKTSYQLTRKFRPEDKGSKSYEFEYNTNGSLLSVAIFKNSVQTGHIRNQYNDLNQVIEQQVYTDYSRFANKDDWSEYINNRVNRFYYDSVGLLREITTEIYNLDSRKWITEVKEWKCSLQNEGNHVIAICLTNDSEYIRVELDQSGNWIRREEFSNGDLKVTIREITYYE